MKQSFSQKAIDSIAKLWAFLLAGKAKSALQCENQISLQLTANVDAVTNNIVYTQQSCIVPLPQTPRTPHKGSHLGRLQHFFSRTLVKADCCRQEASEQEEEDGGGCGNRHYCGRHRGRC